MSDLGFIQLYRNYFKNPLWEESRVYSRAEAWLDLIQWARFDDSKISIKGRVVVVQRGQIVTATRFIANRWKWSTTKVIAFLCLLENEKMINQKKDAQKTTITLCNFDKYNGVKNAQKDGKNTQKKHKKDGENTNYNKDNKDNNSKNDNTTPIPPIGGDDDAAGEWRLDYQTYLTQLREAYKQAKADAKWVAQRENYHKNLDVLLTIEKSCTDYWATEEGWNKKLNSKTKNINWKSTFNTALTVKSNQVYKQKNNPQSNETEIF